MRALATRPGSYAAQVTRPRASLWSLGIPTFHDVFTFECVFLLFFCVSTYKGSPLLAPINAKCDLTVAVIALGWVCGTLRWMLNARKIDGRSVLYAFSYAGFVGYAAISYLLTRVGEDADFKFTKLLFTCTWALYGPLLFMREEKHITLLLRLFVYFAIFVCLEGTVQSLLGSVEKIGTLGNESYQIVGRMAGLAASLLVAFTFSSPRRAGVYLAMAALLIGVVVCSTTRQALVGLIVTPMALCLLKMRGEGILAGGRRLVFAAFGLTLLCGVLGYFFVSDMDTSRFERRVLQFFEHRDAMYDTQRPRLWKASYEIWREHPIFGAGFGSFPRNIGYLNRHSHNLFLEMLCELGIVGCLWYSTVLYVPAAYVWRQSRYRLNPALMACFAGWVFTVTCSMFSGDIIDNRGILTFSSLILTLSYLGRRQRRPGNRCTR